MLKYRLAIILIFVSLAAHGKSSFLDEVTCFKSLYEARIANKRLFDGFVKVASQKTLYHKGIYMVNSQSAHYCPFPKKATMKGKSFKSYDLRLYISDKEKPIYLSHTVQLKSLDFASTIGRLQRALASKEYQDVTCQKVLNNKIPRKQLLRSIRSHIKTTPKKFEQLTQHDIDLQKFPSKISERMITAMQRCLSIPEIQNITKNSFKTVPHY